VADADIISRLQLDARPFSGNLDAALKQAEGQVTASAARINSDIARFSGVATNSAREVVQAYGREVAKVGAQAGQLARAGDIAAASARQQRAAYQGLGFQLSDVVAQASTGTNAFVILAQQGGQTAAALSGLGGAVGRVAGFLSGPFGAAVFGAVTVMGLLATRKREAAQAANDLTDELSAERLVTDDLATSTKELNRLTGATTLTLTEQIGARKAATEVKLQDLLATRKLILAEIELNQEKARAALQRAQDPTTAEEGGFNFAIAAAANAERAVAAGKARADAARLEIEQAQQAVAAAEKKLQAIRTEEAKKGAAERDKVERAAVREAQKELREAEQAREAALLKELELVEAQGAKVRDLAEIYARLEGGADANFDRRTRELRGRFPTGDSLFNAGGSSELKEIAEREIGRALGTTANRFQQEGIVAAQAIAQAFGGSVGGQVNRIAGTLRGLATGDFTSVGGPIGGAATLIGRDPATRRALTEVFKPVAESIGNSLNAITQDLGIGKAAQIGGAAIAGLGVGSAVGGGKEGAIGGALGGAAGFAAGFAIGGPIGGAIGTAVGSILGGLGGGLLRGPKKGSVTIGASGGEFTVGAATGNSASRRSNASALGGSVADSLNRIAEALGADIGSFAVSVGQRDGVFSVDPTGRGNVSKRFGVQQFATAEEAARAAIRDAISDGALTGISQTVVNAIRNASTLERGLDDAAAIQSIGRRLREIEDPIGSAFDELKKQFDDLRDTLRDAGGTVEELAELEKLYSIERERLTTQSVATLQSFLSSLQIGGNSPLSLGDQRRNAELAFSKFESDIRAGRAIDQSAFVSAGQNLLDVDRQIFGGTSGFFDTFRRVEGATGQAISGVQNATAIREAELAAAARSTADSTAATVNVLNEIRLQLERMGSLPGGGGFVGADAAGRGFVRAA
jgi:hypothetical protein